MSERLVMLFYNSTQIIIFVIFTTVHWREKSWINKTKIKHQISLAAPRHAFWTWNKTIHWINQHICHPRIIYCVLHILKLQSNSTEDMHLCLNRVLGKATCHTLLAMSKPFLSTIGPCPNTACQTKDRSHTSLKSSSNRDYWESMGWIPFQSDPFFSFTGNFVSFIYLSIRCKGTPRFISSMNVKPPEEDRGKAYSMCMRKRKTHCSIM